MSSLLVILARFVRFLEGHFFSESPTKSERGGRFQAGKILKIIENVSYLITYCKISLLIYSGSSSLSKVGPFLTHTAPF